MRTSPICTNSAVTPGTFIAVMRSTSAPGNVFSIPKRTPIFFTAPLYRRSGKVGRRHRAPVGPVVLGVVPDMQVVPDALGVQQRRELLVRRAANVMVAGDQHPFVALELVEVIPVS